MSNETGIIAFLTEWSHAELQGDVAWIKSSLTDDFTGIGPLGFMLSKQDWVGRHAPGQLTYETFELDDVQVREFGGAAAVTAHQIAKGAFMGNPVPEHLRATLVLGDQSGAWKLTTIHMSFMAGTPGAPAIPGGPQGDEP
jgi:ketosteroid isomerase-like protein